MKLILDAAIIFSAFNVLLIACVFAYSLTLDALEKRLKSSAVVVAGMYIAMAVICSIAAASYVAG